MKIKQVFNLLSLSVILFACSEESKKENEEKIIHRDAFTLTEKQVNTIDSMQHKNIFNEGSLIGFYVGDFEAVVSDEKKAPSYFNRINISIDSVKNDMVFGHSIVAGNKRPFKGSISQKENLYLSEVKEPGDDKYDGAFTFTINPAEKNLAGVWIANDKKLAVTKRSYSLGKKIFEYNAQQELGLRGSHIVYDPKGNEMEGEVITTDAGKYNASAVLLNGKDIENMYKRDLEVMRNAIYARHGYSFKNRIMRYFFDSEISWYIPVSTDVSKELTLLEKKNIALIKSYEDYATAYYDSFGR